MWLRALARWQRDSQNGCALHSRTPPSLPTVWHGSKGDAARCRSASQRPAPWEGRATSQRDCSPVSGCSGPQFVARLRAQGGEEVYGDRKAHLHSPPSKHPRAWHVRAAKPSQSSRHKSKEQGGRTEWAGCESCGCGGKVWAELLRFERKSVPMGLRRGRGNEQHWPFIFFFLCCCCFGGFVFDFCRRSTKRATLRFWLFWKNGTLLRPTPFPGSESCIRAPGVCRYHFSGFLRDVMCKAVPSSITPKWSLYSMRGCLPPLWFVSMHIISDTLLGGKLDTLLRGHLWNVLVLHSDSPDRALLSRVVCFVK